MIYINNFEFNFCRTKCEACGEEIENITCDLKETVHWTNQAKCSGLTGGDSFETVCVNVVFARLPVKLVNSFSLVVEAKLPLVYIKCVMLSCSYPHQSFYLTD